MKAAVALFGLAWAGLVVQGAVATFVPAAYCPNLALILLLCIGLQWEAFSSGAMLAAAIGFSTDLLSGALLGQHALLFLCVFAVARIAARQLNLPSAASLVAIGAVVGFLFGGGQVFLSVLFFGTDSANSYWRPDLLMRVGISALFTPVIFPLVQSLMARLSDKDAATLAPRLLRSGRVP